MSRKHSALASLGASFACAVGSSPRQVCARRTLTPTPLPMGEGLSVSLLPSGEGAPQGRMRVGRSLAAINHVCAARAVPSPQPLSRWERGYGFSLLPSGEGAPQGRMRVGRSLAATNHVCATRAVPSPLPLSRWERGYGFSLLPPGEGAPQGRMRVGRSLAATNHVCATRAVPSPQPLSRWERGYGFSLLPSGEGAPQGRMRVRAQPRSNKPRAYVTRRTFAPILLPSREGPSISHREAATASSHPLYPRRDAHA